MRILGIEIGLSHFGSRRRRKVTSKLERLTNAALLNAVLGDPEMLATVLDKYGKIETYHDDTETEAKINGIRARIYREAVQTIMNSRGQELASRIDGIIDQVMGIGDRSGKQYEDVPVSGTITSRPYGVTAIDRRRPTREPGFTHSLGLSELLKELEVLVALDQLASQGIQMKGESSTGKTYTVESNGRMVEMDEHRYRNYLHRRRGRQRKEAGGHPLYMARQPRFTGNTKLVPVPPEENKDEFSETGH